MWEMVRPIGVLLLLQILSLLLVSISFSYVPSLEGTDPETEHGRYGYELGLYGKYTEDYIT
jgi:hypothetical protein